MKKYLLTLFDKGGGGIFVTTVLKRFGIRICNCLSFNLNLWCIKFFPQGFFVLRSNRDFLPSLLHLDLDLDLSLVLCYRRNSCEASPGEGNKINLKTDDGMK